MNLIANPRGGYDFLSGIAPYSSGVVAREGSEIVHVTFAEMLPWREGFASIEKYFSENDLSREALCGVELRSPKPFTMEGFDEFNAGYREVLEQWGLMVDGENPVARTNVAPLVAAPMGECMFAFSHTAPSTSTNTTFVVAGGGEVSGGLRNENIVRFGETTPEAMAEKAAFVMDLMELRLNGLGVDWTGVTVTDVYTIHPFHDLLSQILLPRMGAAALKGITHHPSRPPVKAIEFEMDLRGVERELVL